MASKGTQDSWEEIVRGKPQEVSAKNEKADSPEFDSNVGRCGRVWRQGCRGLDVKGADNYKKGTPNFKYHFLSLYSHCDLDGKYFWFVFAAEEHWKLEAWGENDLTSLFDRINDNCLRWIKKADWAYDWREGFPHVKRLELHDVTPKEKS